MKICELLIDMHWSCVFQRKMEFPENFRELQNRLNLFTFGAKSSNFPRICFFSLATQTCLLMFVISLSLDKNSA